MIQNPFYYFDNRQIELISTHVSVLLGAEDESVDVPYVVAIEIDNFWRRFNCYKNQFHMVRMSRQYQRV